MVKNFRLIDLTHTLHSKIPTWNGDCGFQQHLSQDYDPHAAWKFRTYKMNMEAGIGTHIDAPAHCIPGAATIDSLDLNQLLAPCYVINVSRKADMHYCISPEDILAFEQQYEKIKPGSFIIFYTGWAQFWDSPEKYRNDLMFPCISQEAALLLLERNIVGLGIDTLSPDRPELGYPVHKAILGAGKYIVENIAHADKLPAMNSYSLVLPLKIAAGTESPVRLMGFIGDGFI